MKTALKIFLLLALTAYISYAVVSLSRPSDDMVCTGISITFTDSLEQNPLTRDDILRILSHKKIYAEGSRMSRIDLSLVEKVLQESPYIERAFCYYSGQGRLCLRITTLHPVLHAFPAEGAEYYLDRNGTPLQAGGLNANLCVATGNFSRQYARERLLPLAILIHDTPLWSAQITQIHVRAEDEVELIPRVGSHRIVLGDPADCQEKMERLRTFYTSGLPVAGWNKYKIINLSFDGQVVCTKDNKKRN